MADISTLTVGGTQYNIKDSTARTSAAHSHPYLPTAGGTMTGDITMNSGSELIYSSNSQFLRWNTNENDKNSTGRNWYGIGIYINADDSNYNWLNISNYWGINITTRDSNHLKHNGNIIVDSSNYTSYTVTKTGSGASGTWGINISGNAATTTDAKYLMNRGANTVTVTDSSWALQYTPAGHTNKEIIWGQSWKQSGLTYTPSGGSATTLTDTADWRIWLSSSNTSNVLQVNMQIDGQFAAISGFRGNLQGNVTGNVTGNVSGSSGSCTGNAATATKLAAAKTIFGQSFDGSGNVAGQPLVYGSYNTTANTRYSTSGIQVRENGLVGNAQSDISYAPAIGWHWGGRIAATMLFHSDGNFYLRKQDFSTRATLDANLIGNVTGNVSGSSGSCTGNAATATSAGSATKATQDESGNNIKASYASSFSISDHTITLKNKNGASLGTVTVPDNNTTYNVFGKTIDGNYKTAFRTQAKGDSSAGYFISALRQNTANVDGSPIYSTNLGWGNSDTHGYLAVNYSTAEAYLGGGNADKLNWVKKISLDGHSHAWDEVTSKPSTYAPSSHGHGVNTTNVGSASGWSAGSVPTVTAVACDDITSWSAGTAATATVSGSKLVLTNGTVPSLGYTARSVNSVTNVGTAPALTVSTVTVATSVKNS